MSAVAQQLNAEMASVAESAGRGLVQVHNGGWGAGTGTIWHPDELVVTNAHVVSGGPLRVTLPDGRNLKARLLARDRKQDLAALVVEASGLPTIEIGGSRDLQPGQWVLAMGNPWGAGVRSRPKRVCSVTGTSFHKSAYTRAQPEVPLILS